MKRFDFVALGEPMVEFNQTHPGQPDYLQGFGGDTSNATLAAARAGARTAYLTRLGNDPWGKALLALWATEGVNTDAIDLDPAAPTGVYFVTHGSQGHEFSYLRAGSAASRIAAAQDALNRINQSPIIGHGTGYARRMPELPHNLYLQQWVNNGILGLIGYLSFLGISAVCFLRRRFMPGATLTLVAALGSFFSHNVLDQRPFLILYGLLLGLSSLSGGHTRQRQVCR